MYLNNNIYCDVLIIGAGPAGASLAYYLTRSTPYNPNNHLKVVLVEKKNNIESPVRCAELVTANIAKLFDFKIRGVNCELDYMNTFLIDLLLLGNLSLRGLPKNNLNLNRTDSNFNLGKANSNCRNFNNIYSFNNINNIKKIYDDNGLENIKINSTFAPAFLLDRDIFVSNLVNKFIKNGGIFLNSTKVIKIIYSGISKDVKETKSNEIKVLAVNRKNNDYFLVQPKIIVGADGPLSFVGRFLKLLNTDFMIGIQEKLNFYNIIANMNNSDNSINKNNKNNKDNVNNINNYINNNIDDFNSASFYFSPIIKFGYGWVFPKKNYFNVGIGIPLQYSKELKYIYKVFKNFIAYKFCQSCQLQQFQQSDKHQELDYSNYNSKISQGKAISGYSDYSRYNRYNGYNRYSNNNFLSNFDHQPITGLIPVSGIIKTPVYENFVLIGDAAGTCNPITGAGIYNAILSSKILSEIILKYMQTKNIEDLKEFNTIFYKEFSQGSLRALKKRKYLLNNWPSDCQENDIYSKSNKQNNRNEFSMLPFLDLIKKTWPVFKQYYKYT